MPTSSDPRRLCHGGVPSSPTAVYTVGTSERAIVSSISFHNSAGAQRIVEMWIVPDGESRTTSNKFTYWVGEDGESYRESGIGQVLEPGDKIYLDGDNATMDTSYHICGAVLTSV